MITLFKSFPDDSSQNVGDKLIGEAASKILADTTDHKVITYFDEKELLDNITVVNNSEVLFVAAFGIRSTIWRQRFAEAIRNGRIAVPVVPLAAAWSDFPRDYEQITSSGYPRYNDDVINFYQTVADQAPIISARDYYTQRVLSQMDISAQMVGDCAWYDLDFIGEDMYRPESISSIVVTDPHQAQYLDQMIDLMHGLASSYPEADRFFCVHGSDKKSAIKEAILEAESAGFEYRDMSGDTENLRLYSDCDLHIGYRVHGHVSFLRQRRPSVLLCEDGRGLGFTETFGGAGFPAFDRRVSSESSLPEILIQTFPQGLVRYARRKLYSHRTPHPTAPASNSVVERALNFISQELSNGWHRYDHIPSVIDTTYHNQMQPFIRTVINTESK